MTLAAARMVPNRAITFTLTFLQLWSLVVPLLIVTTRQCFVLARLSTSFLDIFMKEKAAKQKAEIEGILKRTGLSREDLATRAAIKPETLRKVIGGYQPASDRMMQSLRNVETVFNSASPPVKSVDTGLMMEDQRIIKVQLRSVPVVSWAAAGKAHDYEDLTDHIEETVQCETKDPNAFALIVEGDSMESEIIAGDRIVISPSSEPRNNDIVVAKFVQDGGVMVKRYRSKGPDVVILHSNNSNYPDIENPRKAFRFIYPAIEIQRRLRR